MPVDTAILSQVVVVGGVIVLLVLVLRWAFARDRRSSKPWQTGADPAESEAPRADDFGLLASAAVVGSEAEARRIRDVLGGAGIKATTTRDRSGRWRVLVFATELHRARRVAGGSS